jgi:hypothetical protein
MVKKIALTLAYPFIFYLDSTVLTPCKDLTAWNKKRRCNKIKVRRTPSMVEMIRRQREMTSPPVDGHVQVSSVTEHYVRQSAEKGGSAKVHRLH